MIYTVVGVSKIKSGNFEGRPWQNRQLHLTRDPYPSDEVTGKVVEMFKVKEPFFPILDSLKVGDEVQLDFNSHGYLQNIIKVK